MNHRLPLFSDPSGRAFLRASDPAFKLKNARRLAGIFVIACAALGAHAQAPANAGHATTEPVLAAIDPTKPAHPGILTSSDPNQPPPFVELPGDLVRRSAGTIDAATAAISPALRARTDAAQADWSKTRGAEFRPDLAYVGGQPILMLVVGSNESVAAQANRLGALVEACTFLLQDDAFDRAIICIATYDAARPQTMTTRNVAVPRDAFQSAVKKAGQLPVLASALAAIRRDDTAGTVRQICADLGIR